MTFRIKAWNEVAGKLNPEELLDSPDTLWSEIDNASKRIEEELKELKEAIKLRDVKEVLDAHVDLWYVNGHLQSLLELAGIDVVEAKDLVCINNDSKFTTNRELALVTKQHYLINKGEACYIKEGFYRGELLYVVLRVSDNKVMKPKGFVDVDIENCIPEGIYKHL